MERKQTSLQEQNPLSIAWCLQLTIVIFQYELAISDSSIKIPTWSLFNKPRLLEDKVGMPQTDSNWIFLLNGAILLSLFILIQIFATKGFATAINSAEKRSETSDEDKQSKPTEN